VWDPAQPLLLSLGAGHEIWALECALVHSLLVCFLKRRLLCLVSHKILILLNCCFFHLSSALVLTKDF